MKRAGPCRGIERATSHASLIVAIFGFTGMALSIPAGLLSGRREIVDVIASLMALHVFWGILLWVPAVAINWLLLRVCRPRSWRHQTWRAWVAGILAVPVNWIGVLFFTPAIQRHSGMREVEALFIGALLTILYTNACIAFAWALPPWTRGVPRRGTGGGN